MLKEESPSKMSISLGLTNPAVCKQQVLSQISSLESSPILAKALKPLTGKVTSLTSSGNKALLSLELVYHCLQLSLLHTEVNHVSRHRASLQVSASLPQEQMNSAISHDRHYFKNELRNNSLQLLWRLQYQIFFSWSDAIKLRNKPQAYHTVLSSH